MNPVPKSHSSISAAVPDPWFVAARSAEPFVPPAWQFPLDPSHELGGAPVPEAIAGAGPPGANLLTKGCSQEGEAITFLLQEELKLPLVPQDRLWTDIQEALTYLELCGPKVS
jgi:hypothetical protein